MVRQIREERLLFERKNKEEEIRRQLKEKEEEEHQTKRRRAMIIKLFFTFSVLLGPLIIIEIYSINNEITFGDTISMITSSISQTINNAVTSFIETVKILAVVAFVAVVLFGVIFGND